MKNQGKMIVIMLCMCMAAAIMGAAPDAWAFTGSQINGGTGQQQSNNTCISDSQYQFGQAGAGAISGAASFAIAEAVIGAVFSSINGIMGNISQHFYEGIIGPQSSFPTVVNLLVIMYVLIYGVLIIFNIIQPRAGDVMVRLAKIGILWSIISTGGWEFFSTYVGNLFLGGMNELISQFGGGGGGSASVPNLDSSAVSMLFAPMDIVFAPKFMTGMLSMATTGQGSWLLTGMLAWGLMDFVFMVIAAIATYVKSMIGLAFLFGISPIFFCCILFEKTRQVFTGWLNEVAAFALLPVLLFAFLSFYVQLLNSVLLVMLPTTLDFCWLHWFSVPNIWDISFWRAVLNGNQNAGAWTDQNGNPLPPPISTLFGLYFLVLSWLGKNFCSYISHIVSDLTQGSGPGMVSADALKGKFMSALGGGGKGGGGSPKTPPASPPPGRRPPVKGPQ